MASSSRTARSGRRTVSPPTRTLPAMMSACARSLDAARPWRATSTSRRVMRALDEEADHDADDRADQHLDRSVAEELAQPLLLHPAHVHEVLDQAVEHGCLTAGCPPKSSCVVHDHEREDEGDGELRGRHR